MPAPFNRKSVRLAVRVGLGIFTLLTEIAAGQGPELLTPGTASWVVRETAKGTRTIFTITDDTILDWDQLNVSKGSKLIFKFEGGENILNHLGGTGSHFIHGAVNANGNVAFISPRADLTVSGSISAKNVTLTTLKSDLKAHQNSGFNFLTINGNVQAKEGDVFVAGEQVIIGPQGRIEASNRVKVAGSRDVSLSGSSVGVAANGPAGYVLQLGKIQAPKISVVAGREIRNQGKIDAGSGRIFLKVGSSGEITNETTGIIVGDAAFEGTYHPEGVLLVPDEADAIPAVSDGTLTIPALTRPGRTAVSSARIATSSAPISASEDSGRPQRAPARKGSQPTSKPTKTPPSATAVAMRGATHGKKPLLQRSSFFGVRGSKPNTP